MELQELVPLGGHPPGLGWELLLGVNFLMDPYWRKSHTIARNATKSYVNRKIAKLAFFICVG